MIFPTKHLSNTPPERGRETRDVLTYHQLLHIGCSNKVVIIPHFAPKEQLSDVHLRNYIEMSQKSIDYLSFRYGKPVFTF